MFVNNSATTNIESWCIPFDILLILCAAFTIIVTLISISIIITDRTCHTVPMMLTANTCFGVLTFGIVRICMSAFSLKNDLQQIAYQYPSCILLAYVEYVSYAVQNYSLFQQAFYRFMVVVYPARLFWQSVKFQLFLICLTWLFGFGFSIAFVLTGEIQYNIPNQICQIPLRLSFLMLYDIVLIYIVPILAIIFVYLKLVRYVKEMSKRVTPANTLLRAERELKIVRRTVILVGSVVAIGFPYTMFLFASFFTSLPQYHLRIAYVFVDVSLAFMMVVLFQFTEPIKEFLMKNINGQMNRVLPTIT